ncbi:polysaccharide biosynthesis C-terminal domain-containing protein [bacterium]|nr:polysaccharide biosynthesis C-terminal domain-containing protein [bacterium]MBO6072985.1 polysaccharide biosynthesis C-terminal domain-containing protein [bacterium]MBO6094727.1 polysaccharide biosynthesis C-terminal domain-containing protein [bacterium]MBO7043050.1 polysaccharide biosynthesis C-terminal domain-containing protein [bacterium]
MSSIVRLNVNIIRSHGRTLLITLIMVCDTILNIILDYILIYYAQIGMDGAAVATLIS